MPHIVQQILIFVFYHLIFLPELLLQFRFIIPFLPFYHNSESVEIGSFPGRFPTLWIYGAGGHLGVDLG